MNFPGTCKLELTAEAIQAAIEGALNSARKDGEDYVHVTGISQSYSYGPWTVSITTDKPEVQS